MSPERMARLVATWVRFYTRGLPPEVAQRRVEELDADVHDHIEHGRSLRTSGGRIVLGVAARMLRGMAADAAWRRGTIARDPTRARRSKMNRLLRRPVVVVALVTAFVLMANLLAMLLTNEVNWGVFDFVFAAAVLGGSGLLLARAVGQRNTAISRGGAVAVGVAAIVLGEADDAPGLVGFGCLLILGMVALGINDARRREHP